MSSEIPAQTEAGAPAPAPVKAAGGNKKIIIAVVVVVVIVVAVMAAMLLMGNGIEGTWTFESIEVFDADGNLDEDATALAELGMGMADGYQMELKSDGTYVTEGETGTWETDGDTLIIDGEIMGTYSVSGDTLSIEMEGDGVFITGSIVMNFERA